MISAFYYNFIVKNIGDVEFIFSTEHIKLFGKTNSDKIEYYH